MTSHFVDNPPIRRDAHDLLISIETTNQAILAELRHIRNAIGEKSRSSVEITTGTSGKPFGLTVKSYVDSPVIDAEVEALASFLRVRAELEHQVLEGWRQTIMSKKGIPA